jgi:predicted nuclease of restriction endonuclease-like (RecB) superfamily
LIISDKDKRAFYEQECINSSWPVRELKRQIETSLFERRLLSEGKANKETILALSKQGIAIGKPEDILRKDPS